MDEMGGQQKKLLTEKMRRDEREAERRRKKMKMLRDEAIYGFVTLFTMLFFGFMIAWVVDDRIKKYPQYGTGWIPKSEDQRKRESMPPVYIGR